MLAMSSGFDQARPDAKVRQPAESRPLPTISARTRSVIVAEGDGVDADFPARIPPPWSGSSRRCLPWRRCNTAAGNAHQRHVRRHVDDRTAAGFDQCRDAEAAVEERAGQVELITRQNSSIGASTTVLSLFVDPPAVIVQDVQRAIVVQSGFDCGPHAVLACHIGRHRDATPPPRRLPARFVRRRSCWIRR